MNLWDLSIFKMGLNQPLPGFLKWNNMECRGIIHHFFSSQSSIRYRYVAIAHCFIRISARFPYIYKVLYYLHISLYISLYIFIYLCISLYIFIYLYIIFIYLSFFQHLILGIQYLTGLQHTGEAASESGIQWLNYDGDSQGFIGVSGISWYIYIYILYLAGGFNHLEKWWSSSMGRMTSLLYEMENWIHVPNHQPDDY
jgi:hypothetical protein